MMSVQILWLSLIVGLSVINSVFGVVVVKEVNAGHLAELPCLSSDDRHRFMFWELNGDNIIGPGNTYDVTKYNYEVLTGKLMIRGVSTAESGFYECISKGIDNNSAINTATVELIVKKDWEDVWENDFETNLLRGMAAVMVLVVAVAVILLIITVKRKKNNGFYDIDESRDNSPARYSGSTRSGADSSTTRMNKDFTGITTEGIDNAAMNQVDFPKVFKQMQPE